MQPDIPRPNQGAACRKFTVEQVQLMRRAYDNGVGPRKIARSLGISRSTVHNIVSRRGYAWVPEEEK